MMWGGVIWHSPQLDRTETGQQDRCGLGLTDEVALACFRHNSARGRAGNSREAAHLLNRQDDRRIHKGCLCLLVGLRSEVRLLPCSQLFLSPQPCATFSVKLLLLPWAAGHGCNRVGILSSWRASFTADATGEHSAATDGCR
jgi:hypothetical protein